MNVKRPGDGPGLQRILRRMLAKTAANSWENVHEFAMQLAGEAK